MEFVRCQSAQCADTDRAKEDAARLVVGKVRDELVFRARDFNLQDGRNAYG